MNKLSEVMLDNSYAPHLAHLAVKAEKNINYTKDLGNKWKWTESNC